MSVKNIATNPIAGVQNYNYVLSCVSTCTHLIFADIFCLRVQVSDIQHYLTMTIYTLPGPPPKLYKFALPACRLLRVLHGFVATLALRVDMTHRVLMKINSSMHMTRNAGMHVLVSVIRSSVEISPWL